MNPGFPPRWEASAGPSGCDVPMKTVSAARIIAVCAAVSSVPVLVAARDSRGFVAGSDSGASSGCRCAM